MNHEYSVLGGINRARVGQIIGALAAAISSALVALLLAALKVASAFGLDEYVPAVLLPPIGAGVVFTVLYWFFDRHAWKLPYLKAAIGVPNLGGEWRVEGQTLNPDKSPSFVWAGDITIVQTWDRIRVRLKTQQSGSNSITAALVRDEADGFRLFYSYRNDPRADQPELQTHRGWAEITFNHALSEGEGEYFNGLGRFTFGVMKLTRKV